jgi:hypothetical protein
MECVRSRCFSGPYAGSGVKSRLLLGAVIIALAASAVLSQKVLIEDALNGLIAAFGFNILYDFFLSQRLKWCAHPRSHCLTVFLSPHALAPHHAGICFIAVVGWSNPQPPMSSPFLLQVCRLPCD